MIDRALLDAAAAGAEEAAADIKAIATILRDKEIIDGNVHLSPEMRDKLCGWLDKVATLMDDWSIAAGLDAEDTLDRPDETELRAAR